MSSRPVASFVAQIFFSIAPVMTQADRLPSEAVCVVLEELQGLR